MREYSYTEILEGVLIETRKIMCADQNEVTPDSNLFTDFGDESLEFLELSFQVKKRFNLELPCDALFENWKVDSSGQLNPASIAQLSGRFPTINWSERISRLNGKNPIEVLTLEVIAKLVHSEQY